MCFDKHYFVVVVTFNSFRRSAIHAEAPEFVEMSTEQEILVTGIKVVDLLAPYAKGGKIGMFHKFVGRIVNLSEKKYLT